jgi:hypothetical protein
VLRFRRPSEPSGFADSMREARESVRMQVADGVEPEFDDGLWKQHKDTFIEAQCRKCGYCETFAINHPGAVEHYAPKSRIEELAEEGIEEVPGISVAGRKTPPVCDRGYWWLAYSWENWLFSCERCNTGWKRCLFPVWESPRLLPPQCENSETPLLLNPFGSIDPVEHLEFSSVGQIFARNASEHGNATIKTCGLDRESLRKARQNTALNAHRQVKRLLTALHENDLLRAYDATVDLLELGDEESAHAGMVRAIVRTELQRSWGELQKLHDRLAEQAS